PERGKHSAKNVRYTSVLETKDAQGVGEGILLITGATTAAYVSRMKASRDPSGHTLKAYASDLRDYLRFIAQRELCPGRSDTLMAYAEHLMVDRVAAPRTLRRRMACLRGFYRDLVRSGQLDHSPFSRLEMQLPRPRT